MKLRTRRIPYIGSLTLEDVGPVGSRAWDPEEEVWVVRVRDQDEPFACGFECCGTAEPALMQEIPIVEE